MAIFRNLGVNLRDRLCDVPTYVSAQSLDFLDLAKNYSFLNWKLVLVPIIRRPIYGWALVREITSINLSVSRYHFLADFQRETSEKAGQYDPAFTIFLSV